MSFLIHRTRQYLRYFFLRKGAHNIHSPFVFDFYNQVVCEPDTPLDYSKILKARNMVFNNKNLIETVDFGSGAGGKEFSTYLARVNVLAKKRSLPLRYYKLLHRIALYLKPETMLEFGTFTGLASTSLASANANAQLITMEGCASLANVAQSVFSRNELENIELVIGNFNHVLGSVLENHERFDLVFVDGNHRKEPTLDYFFHCLSKTGENSVFIFDDIHWSPEMDEAWKIICEQPEVSLSLDLFQFGLVFFKKGMQKQHFVLRM